MPKKRLTNAKVRALKAPHSTGKQVIYWDTEVKGFGVLCSGVTDAKSYVVQRDVGGKTKRITIGACGDFEDIDDARDEARDAKKEMKAGVSPKVRRPEAGGVTLGQALENLIEDRTNSKTLKPSTIADYQWNVNRYFSDWIDMPLQDITRDMCITRFHAIRNEVAKLRRTKLAKGEAAANGAMRVFRLIWNHAEFRSGTSWGENPISKWGDRKLWHPTVRRTTIVKTDDLPKFYKAIKGLSNALLGDYLLLVLFTGLRRNEAAGLTWKDVNLDEKMIHIPASRTKASRQLDLPMSDFIHNLLVARRAVGGDFVFPSNSKSGHVEEPGFALKLVAQETGINVSIHDLRRTYITVAGSTGIPVFALKALVNHAMGNDVTEGYYVPSADDLREAQQQVTDRLKELVGIEGREAVEKVVQLTR